MENRPSDERVRKWATSSTGTSPAAMSTSCSPRSSHGRPGACDPFSRAVWLFSVCPLVRSATRRSNARTPEAPSDSAKTSQTSATNQRRGTGGSGSPFIAGTQRNIGDNPRTTDRSRGAASPAVRVVIRRLSGPWLGLCRKQAQGVRQVADPLPVPVHARDDSDFDELAAAAATIADAPIALISLIRGDSYWFRRRAGYDEVGVPRVGSFCDEVAAERLEFSIADTLAEPRFADHPMVTGEPFVRAYAGFPLILGDGELVGSLCVVDHRPRPFPEEQKALLRVLARQAGAQLDLRRQTLANTSAVPEEPPSEDDLAINRIAEAQALAKLGSWEWDIATEGLTWSAEMFRMFGLGGADHVQTPTAAEFIELVHPDDRADFVLFMSTMARRGGRAQHQMRTLGPDGVERFVEGWLEAVLDPVSSKILVARGMLQDVTDRIARETALAGSEQRLRLTIENSPIGIALIGLDGSWLQINDALTRILGYCRADLSTLTFQDITHPDDLDADLALLAELRDGTRDSYQLEKRYRHAEGRTVWVNLTASVARRGDGTPLHYVSQLEDITARRTALAELEAERDFSAALLAALHDGYAYLEGGRIVVVNDVICRMTGYPRADLIGSRAAFLLDDAAEPGARSRLADLIDRSGSTELTIRRRDGSTFDASIQLEPVHRPDVQVSGYVAVIRDITDRKTRERRLRHQADHDGLTGLLNQAAFHVRLREGVAAAYASGSTMSVAIMDLDRFKMVNDTHGHQAGDAVLAEFADRLRGNARGDDVLGRVGGEEFGLVMRETDLGEAIAAVGRTLDAVRRHSFPHVSRLTFSAGVAELRTTGTTHAADEHLRLLARADQALYAAKRAGRDRVVGAALSSPDSTVGGLA